MKVQAGALLSKVGSAARDAGLAGFECASGIPGTMGGAVFMNAGAYGGEMKDILTEVTVLDENNEVRVLKKMCIRDREEVFKAISKEEVYNLTGNQFENFNTIFQLYSLVQKRPWILDLNIMCPPLNICISIN